MKALNILLSVFACHPEGGSEPQIGWKWATTLAEHGHSVWVLTRTFNKERIERSLNGKTLPRLHFIYVEVPLRKYLKNETSGAAYAAWQVGARVRAKQLMKTVKFDLIQHSSFGAIQFPSLLCTLGIPTVFGPAGGGQTTPKSMLPLLGGSQRNERIRTAMIAALPVSPLHRFLMHKTKLVLATNRETGALARRMGCNNVATMLDSGLATQHFAESPRTPEVFGRTTRLIWVGRALPRKALRLALKAIALTEAPVHLDIIGPTNAEDVMRLVQQLNLADRVTLHGSVSFDRMQEFYRTSDCLLFSSLRDSFGSQLLEAAGKGLAIICLDHQGAAEFVTEGMGIRIAPTTPEETAQGLAAAIDRYVRMTSDQKAQMSKESLEHAHKFDWKQRIAQMDNVYARLIGSEETAA